MKALREKINAGYVRHNERLLELLEEMYPDVEGKEYRHQIEKLDFKPSSLQIQKSIQAMYEELYQRVELDKDFEQDYETWADAEVFMNDVY